MVRLFDLLDIILIIDHFVHLELWLFFHVLLFILIIVIQYPSRHPIIISYFTYACFILDDKYCISYVLSVGIYERYATRLNCFCY